MNIKKGYIIKKVIFALFIGMFSISAFAYDFCNGFEKGFITGYKQASGRSGDPLVPPCPLQPSKGLSDPESDYEHGYIIGYEKGLRKGWK